MSFEIFQTETGTLKKVTLDGTGSESVSDSFSVECSVEWERNRAIGEDGEDITAEAMVFISPHDDIDITHRRWDFDFEGETYKVEKLRRIKDIGSNNISHYEAVIR